MTYSTNNPPGHVETDPVEIRTTFPIRDIQVGKKKTDIVPGIPWKNYDHIRMLKKNRKPFFVAHNHSWVTGTTKKVKGQVFIRVSELVPGEDIAIYDYNSEKDFIFCEGVVESVEIEAARVVMRLKEITAKKCKIRCAQILGPKIK